MFVFILCLKQIFLGITQFGGAQKYLGVHCPRMPPAATGLSGAPQKRRKYENRANDSPGQAAKLKWGETRTINYPNDLPISKQKRL